ncbi:APC family permease [Aerophototrophica crusticola]
MTDQSGRLETDMGPDDEPPLRRTIGLPQMALYSLGSMLGAGIYGLIGKAAGEMGSAVWLAFLVAMVAALLTGLSYASLGSRYPRAGGAAYVTQKAYGMPLLTYLVGLAVMCSGITSVATQSRVVATTLQRSDLLAAAPTTLLALGFLLLLAGIVFRGIKECMWLNVICTLVEAGGLLVIIAVGASYWGSVSLMELPPAEDGSPGVLSATLLLQGAVLTFFSFIGFEDSMNVAEEVKNPRRTLPWGIVIAMVAATFIYLAVSVTAVSVVPWQELKEAAGPLVEVANRAAPWIPPAVFVVITLFAVGNTALLNYVMASRLVYGMSRQGLLPRALGHVHPGRRTPHMAILALLALVVALMLAGDITALASATVILLLFVFTIVNVALVVLKRRPEEPRGGFEVPIFVPVLGAAVCLALLGNRVLTGDATATMLAGVMLAGIVALYAAMRPKRIIDVPVREDTGEEAVRAG